MIEPAPQATPPAMRSSIFTIALSSTLTLAGCGEPCGIPSVKPGGVVIAAEACDDSSTSSASSGDTDGASETTAPTNSTTSASSGSSTGDMMPVCTAVPNPGEFWGPCTIGEDPNADPMCSEGFCQKTPLGNLCMPACDADGCEMFKCFGGTCRVDGACIPPCSTSADCILPGTICDIELEFPMCVYPAFAPMP